MKQHGTFLSHNGIFSHLDHISDEKILCIIITEISHGQTKTNLNSFLYFPNWHDTGHIRIVNNLLESQIFVKLFRSGYSSFKQSQKRIE